MSWPLYFERFVSRSCTEASFCLRAFCEASSAALAASRCGAVAREPVLDLLAAAGDLGEVGLDALQLGFGVVEADELLEVRVHGRERGRRGHGGAAFYTGGRRGAGEWAWKDSNLRLAGYEPAVLTS